MAGQAEAAVFFAEGFEEIEALTVVDLMRRAGIECTMIAVGTGTQVTGAQVTGSHGITVSCDATLDDVDLYGYQMLVLPGGMPGTLGLKACAPLAEALAAYVEGGKDVAAICAAPSVLAELGLLSGRRATSHPSVTDVLVGHGAVLSEDGVVTDGNVVTSRGMGTAIDFGLTLVARMRGDDAAAPIAKAIVYA